MLQNPAKIDVNCPVCDSGRYRIRYEPRVDILDPAELYGAASGVPGTQSVVVCEACGMIYENPRFSEDVILLGYTQSDDSSHDSQYAMRLRSFYRSLEALKSHLPGMGARALDVGTAGGAFLEAAQAFGYDAIGIEPSRHLVEQGRKRGLAIEQATLDCHSFAQASFDLVCMWDVIEHLPDPKRTLQHIRGLLKRDGLLLINYPDIGTWQAKLAGRRFWWLLSVHLHYFTRSTIRDLCQRTGFDVLLTRRYWQTLELGYLEDMAIHYRIPFGKTLKHLTPVFLQRLPVPYYASQTTVLAKIRP